MEDFDFGLVEGSMAPGGSMSGDYSAPVSVGNAWSGVLQTGIATGASYLNRRLDIDLQSRLAGMQPTVYRGSNQGPIQTADLTTRTVAGLGGMRMGDMLPLVALALGAWFFLGGKKG